MYIVHKLTLSAPAYGICLALDHSERIGIDFPLKGSNWINNVSFISCLHQLGYQPILEINKVKIRDLIRQCTLLYITYPLDIFTS